MLRQINQAAIKFLTPVNSEDTYREIVEEAKKLVSGESGSILLNMQGTLTRVFTTADFIKTYDLSADRFINEVYRQGRLQTIEFDDDTPIKRKFHKQGINALIILPLRYKKRTIGLLVLHLKQVFKLTKDGADALELYGNLASLAIRNALLHEQNLEALKAKSISQTSENMLGKVNKASLKFLLPLATEENYSIIVSEALKLIGAQFGSLVLKSGDGFKRVYTNLPGANKVNIRKRGYTFKAYSEKKIIIVHSNTHKKKMHPSILALGIRTNIFLPLIYKNESIGVVALHSRRDYPFTDRELGALRLYASLASLALKKAQLHTETLKALHTRDLFISMAAHELRTPLTTINGYIQMLRRKILPDDSTEARWVAELSGETYRLTELVNELLAVNRIKSGGELQYIFRECSLKTIINRALSNVHFVYPERLVTFQDQLIDSQDMVIGDFDKLLQVITNLIDNAIKYSSAVSEVIIKLKTDPPFVVVSIKDSGQGISKSELPKIFDEFYANHRGGQEGIGLGLFLSRNIVMQHHGKIKVQSKVNKGTTVEVKLPKVAD